MIDDLSLADVFAVKEKYQEDLMNIKGVSGVAIGESDGRWVITIFVEERTEALQARLPRSLDGFPVELEVTGQFQAL